MAYERELSTLPIPFARACSALPFQFHTTRKILFLLIPTNRGRLKTAVCALMLSHAPLARNAAVRVTLLFLCGWQEAWVHFAEMLHQSASLSKDPQLAWSQLLKPLTDCKHSTTEDLHNTSWSARRIATVILLQARRVGTTYVADIYLIYCTYSIFGRI